MKKMYLWAFLLFALMGCKWELPEESKTLKNCARPTALVSTPDLTELRRFVLTLSGSTTDVAAVAWKVTSAAGQVISQVTNQNAAPYQPTLSADGTYTVSAEITTTCGDKLSYTATIVVNTQLPIARSIVLTDPMVHSGLNTVAVANDGTLLANDLRDIKVWNPSTRTLLRTLKGHTGNVSSMVLSPDEKYLYSASNSSDVAIYVWDWKAGTQIRTLSGHTGSVGRLQISADGKYLASIGGDKTIRVWDTTTWQQIRALGDNSWYANGTAICIGSNLVSGVFNNNGVVSFVLWNFLTGTEVWRQVLSGTNSFYGAAFSPDGQQFVISHNSNGTSRIQVYDVNTKQVVRELGQYAYNPIVSLDGKYLICGYQLFSFPALNLIQSKGLYGLGGTIGSISVNGQYAAVAVQGAVDVYQTTTGSSLISTRTNLPLAINSAAFSSDAKQVAAMDYGGQIRVWDLATGQNTATHTPPATGAPSNQLAFTADARFIISTGGTNSKIINVSDGNLLRSINNTNGIYYNAAFVAPDGSFFASPSGSTVWLREVATGNTIRTLSGHSSPVNLVCASPDSKRVASAGSDYTVRLWDAATGNQIRSLSTAYNGNNLFLYTLAFSSDGKYLTGTGSNVIWVWTMDSNQAILSTDTWTDVNSINAVVFSPNAKLLATGLFDGRVRIWNYPAKTLFKEVTLSAAIRRIQFSPDGKQLYVVTEKDLQVLTIQ